MTIETVRAFFIKNHVPMLYVALITLALFYLWQTFHKPKPIPVKVNDTPEYKEASRQIDSLKFHYNAAQDSIYLLQQDQRQLQALQQTIANQNSKLLNLIYANRNGDNPAPVYTDKQITDYLTNYYGATRSVSKDGVR